MEYTWVTRDNTGKRELTATGAFQKGKMRGQWVERDKYWVYEGSYKDGKKHGQWVERGVVESIQGTVYEVNLTYFGGVFRAWVSSL